MTMLAFVAVAATIAPAASAASPQEICAAIQAGTPGTYSQADMDAYNSALQSDPTIQGYCSPLPPPPPPTCVPSTSGGTNGTTGGTNGTTGGTNGTTETCGSTPPPTPPSTPPAQGVAPASSAPVTQVLGATKTKTAPAATVAPQKTTAAPLAATKATGTLPFTGAELTIFALVGAGLLIGGLMLRTSARRRDDTA